jgi:ubiquinone/menaquinone biosynthesis C-methylase UbiE
LEPLEYEIMYHVEDSHWWYQGMTTISRAVLQRWLHLRTNLRILDAGCGTGAAIQSLLSEYGRVAGLDLSMQALEFCRQRKVDSLTCGSVEGIPFASHSFDLVTSFDVLYSRSVPDVYAALEEIKRVLSPGGHLLLRLPAYDWLRGRHDEAVHTARRFTVKGIKNLLHSTGFTVIHSSYANTILFPFALGKRLAEHARPKRSSASDLIIRFGLLNRFFHMLLSLEAPLVARTFLPYGLSVVVMAQKP